MTPETEALIARVRELDAKATPGPLRPRFIDAIDIVDSGEGRVAMLTQLKGPGGSGGRRDTNEVEANAELFAFYRTAAPQLTTALEATEKRADAEKWRADQADAYIKKLDGIIEEIGGVTFSCINPYEDLKSTIVGLKARADAAEAKLKVAQIALERIDKRSARPTTGTSELWAIAANALEALTQLSPENQS